MHSQQLQPQPLCRHHRGSSHHHSATAIDQPRRVQNRILQRTQHLCKALHSCGSWQHAKLQPAWSTTQHADTTQFLLGPTAAASRLYVQANNAIVTAAAAAADAAVSSRSSHGSAVASPAAAEGSAGSAASIRAAAQQQSLDTLEWRDVCRQVGVFKIHPLHLCFSITHLCSTLQLMQG
jgi:hypothetical protein